MPASGFTRTRATVSLILRTGSGNALDVGAWDGDVSVSGLEPGFKSSKDLMDRGTYDGSVPSDDVMPTISITLRHRGGLTSTLAGTVLDMCLGGEEGAGRGKYSSDATTDPEGRVWHTAADVVVAARDGVNTISAPNVRWKIDYNSGDVNTIALSGTCKRGSSMASATDYAPITIT